MASQWFIDETKERLLRMAVVEVDSSEVGWCRVDIRRLTQLRKGGALHFNNETDSVRVTAYEVISRLPVKVLLVEVPGVKPVRARELAVRFIARRAADSKPRVIGQNVCLSFVCFSRLWRRVGS